METNKIIITGGAARIGAAIAKKLSAPGVEIVIHYNKSKVHAEKLKKELSKNSTKVYLVKGNLKKHLKVLNKKMKESASNLEFEEAAKIRDEIRKLESTELEITLNPKVKQHSLNNKIYPKGRSTMGMPGTRAKKGKKKWKQIK